MRFLVDAQLPERLCRWLREQGHDAVHVCELPTGNRSTDAEVAAAADTGDRVLVSKDADFRHDHLLRGRPRRLLAVVTGNISNETLLDLFGSNLAQILLALEESEFVEMTGTELVVHGERTT